MLLTLSFLPFCAPDFFYIPFIGKVFNMYLIVGLGNPDKKYDLTRHNIGFDMLDIFASSEKIQLNKTKFKSIYGDGSIYGEKVILAKPQTYMNNSGEAVRDIVSFYKIPPQNIIVLVDDINFDTGVLRIRPKGSDGGHNGLKSIIYHLNSDQFPRIRIGVGAKPHPDADLAAHVLGRFSKDEISVLDNSAKNVCEAIKLIIKNGNCDMAMNKYNGK